MKKLIFACFWLFLGTNLQAAPTNLYEQLCEVNQEWLKYSPLAKQMGLFALPPIAQEQELLVTHIQLLESIFKARTTAHLTHAQRQARCSHLEVLHAYWQRRDCPQNYYLPYRNPVFIDHEGRYCAVGYLMLKSGLQTFCEAVQQTNNFVFIRQITHPTFHAWQKESGLSLDELAWIQPGYNPRVNFIDWGLRESAGKLKYIDSASTVKIYDTRFDHVDMFNFQQMFWGSRKPIEKVYKKYAATYKGTKPDWSKLDMEITAMTVYKNELYIAVDTTIAIQINDTTTNYEVISKVLKWNPKKEWETVHEVRDGSIIRCFFESKGRLYAGGGGRQSESKIIMKTGDYEYSPHYVHSFLASTNGTKGWEVSKQEFGGTIFGLVYKNKKRYLGIVYNNMAEIEINAPLRE